MERPKTIGKIMIECPSTIFYLYVSDESELSKIETFMNNIRTLKKLGIHDIYCWCNRHGIVYDTAFNYHKEFSVWRNINSFFQYFRQKYLYQADFKAA